MKEWPILFSGPMVRAILEGHKTQTRRVLKPQPPAEDWLPKMHSEFPRMVIGYTGDGKLRNDVGRSGAECSWCCPYGAPGDRLWVRESFAKVPASAYCHDRSLPHMESGDWWVVYKEGWDRVAPTWKPSIHLPRWASRLTLEVTGIRVERLQDISAGDIGAEGAVEAISNQNGEAYKAAMATATSCARKIQRGYLWGIWAERWDSINAKRGFGWDRNPWVWVVEFRRLRV